MTLSDPEFALRMLRQWGALERWGERTQDWTAPGKWDAFNRPFFVNTRAVKALIASGHARYADAARTRIEPNA